MLAEGVARGSLANAHPRARLPPERRILTTQDATERSSAPGAKPVMAALATQHRYNSKVFLTPPWPEIYAEDPERRHGFGRPAPGGGEQRQPLDANGLGKRKQTRLRLGNADHARTQSPDLPPRLAASWTGPITIARSIAFAMS